MAENLILLVDETNMSLRGGTMDEAQLHGIWHRIARVMVEDGEGSVLLQQRRADDFYMAGLYDNSASGHVDWADTSDVAAAHREALEELRLDLELQEIDYYQTRRVDGARTYNRFNRLFRAIVPRQTVIEFDQQELAGVRWFDIGWLRQDIVEHPDLYTPALVQIISKHYT